MPFKRVKIVFAVCGSVAAVEAPKIVRELRREGIDVECVMTDASQEVIHPNVLKWASGNRVITKLTGDVEHVRLCGDDGEASLLLVCPATANTISKIASGIDDTPVTTFASTAMGSSIPIVIVPAMHSSMYRNPFVARSMEKLKKEGVKIIKPRMEEGKAKIANLDKIIKEVLMIVKK